MARTAEVKRDARIGEAEAKRDAQVLDIKIDIRPKDTFFLCLEEKIYTVPHGQSVKKLNFAQLFTACLLF